LALPLVVLMLAALGSRTIGPDIVLELVFGIALGVGVPWVAARLERLPLFSVTDAYAPLYGFALGLLVFSLASITHANEFLAAFAAGVTMRTASPTLCDAFHPFGTHIAELLKLAGLLVFGALISPQWLLDIAPHGYVFAVLSLLVVRPGALWVALARSPLTWREWATVAWFGPKGFASMFFGLLILQAAVPHATHLFHLLAVVIAGSIIAHSSTDVLVARWVQRS
jgi:NhaP-type Na+/H+ and K+/H+ antiporter